ncbi:MAG: hypothetical protein EOP09_12190 [Proteobacteria bacterium]|nr:MAG: hypothetical protein EOP09_12190 [Pseudomonadota bacterium]
MKQLVMSILCGLVIWSPVAPANASNGPSCVLTLPAVADATCAEYGVLCKYAGLKADRATELCKEVLCDSNALIRLQYELLDATQQMHDDRQAAFDSKRIGLEDYRKNVAMQMRIHGSIDMPFAKAHGYCGY